MKIKPHHVFALALMGAAGAWAAEGANASLGSFNSSLAPLSHIDVTNQLRDGENVPAIVIPQGSPTWSEQRAIDLAALLNSNATKSFSNNQRAALQDFLSLYWVTKEDIKQRDAQGAQTQRWVIQNGSSEAEKRHIQNLLFRGANQAGQADASVSLVSGVLVGAEQSRLKKGGPLVDTNRYPQIGAVLGALGITTSNARDHQHHFHIYFKPPAPEAIAAARNLLAESSGELPFSSGIGQTAAQFYQDSTFEEQAISVLAQAQLPKADRVVKVCRAFIDGPNVIPGDDAKHLFVKWRGRAPQDPSWQKEWNALSVLSVSSVEKPSFGTYKESGDDPSGDHGYTYVPPSPEFTGKDRFSFLVKLSNGKSVLMRYQMEPGYMDHSFYNQECVFATRLGQTQLSSSELKGLVYDPSSWLRSSQLSALLATASESFAGFSDLQGSAVGTTVGEGSSAQIALDPTAAGHGWYIDPTPLDNTDDYLPTSNPNIWQAKAGSEAAGKMDMLSVLLHEYGHALGLEHSANSSDFMAATLQAGERRLPSADELTLMSQLVAQLKAGTALADGSTPTDPTSPTVPNPSLPLGALLIGRLALGRKPEDAEQGSQALFSANPTLQGGNLSTLQDWATQGTVVANPANGNAPTGVTLSETGATQTRLNQVFTLSNLALDDATNGPDDAFEAALLNANTGADLLSPLALSHTDALLNLQAGNNGLAELAAQGVTHFTHADGSRTYLVDLSGIARDADGTVAVNLSFDLIGFGANAATMGSHVQVSDVRLLGLPETQDDSFSGAEDNTLTLNALANDTDAVQSGFAPVVLAGPAHGSIRRQ